MSAVKQSFIKGTMILLAAGIINRILGFIPRITLPRVIGAEGVGLYQLGYPFLIVLITVVTGGLPLAVAKLVSEAESEGQLRKVRSIFRVAMTLAVGVSLFFTVICYVCAGWITKHLMTDPRVYSTFLMMTPIIVIIAVSSVYRGYFQGRHNMIPTALSQIVETIVRIIGMLVLSYLMLPYGLEYAAAGAMAGVLAGEVCGMLLLVQQYYRHRSREQAEPHQKRSLQRPPSTYSIFRNLLSVSIPVTGSKLVGSASYFLESVMIVQSLAIIGIAGSLATAQYGALQGMIIPILLLPGALTYSLSVSLIPSLSEAAARGDMRTIHKRLHQSLRLALVTGAPFVIWMYLLADQICLYLYNDISVAPMLRLMAPFALFLYFQGPLQAALQALDKPGNALLNTFVGAAIKLTAIYLLIAKLEMGILGAVLAINLNIVLVTLLHYRSISKLLRFNMSAEDVSKVGGAMILIGILIAAADRYVWPMMSLSQFLLVCSASGLLYLLIIVKLKMIDRYDIARIPWIGPRINKWI